MQSMLWICALTVRHRQHIPKKNASKATQEREAAAEALERDISKAQENSFGI